jgi:membrane protein
VLPFGPLSYSDASCGGQLNLRRRFCRYLILIGMVGRDTIRKFINDNGPFLASALAFSLLLYSIPLALILISLLGYTVLGSDQAMEEMRSVIAQFFPSSEQAFTDNVAVIVADRGLLGTVGFSLFLVFSTMVFGSIRHVLNGIFKVRPVPNMLHGMARDLLMMAFCTALLAATIACASVFNLLMFLWHVTVGTESFVTVVIHVAQKVMSFFLGGVLVFGLYRLSSATKLSSRSLIVGSIFTVLLFETAKQAFTWYVHFAEYHLAVYGMLGTFVFFFLWLYYASILFILGAEAAWVSDEAIAARLSAAPESLPI